MKKSILAILASLLLPILFIACTSTEEKDNLFYDTYKNILIIRNNNSEDTAKANKLVKELIKKNGYTDKSFKDEFIRLSEQPNTFAKKIDSVRTIAIGM